MRHFIAVLIIVLSIATIIGVYYLEKARCERAINLCDSAAIGAFERIPHCARAIQCQMDGF